jgi:hypothetical protein
MAIYTGIVPSGKFLLQQMVNSSKLKMKFKKNNRVSKLIKSVTRCIQDDRNNNILPQSVSTNHMTKIRHTLITDIKPVLNWRTPRPSLLGSKFCAMLYACSHTEIKR